MSRRLHCFGQSNAGQLGVRLLAAPQSSAIIMRPVQVIGAPTGDQGCSVVEVACGADHTLMRTEDGQVWSCGGNDFGQLGRSSQPSGSCTIYPVVFNGARIIQVACGSKHSLAVADDGRLFAWGSNSHGQLGTRLPSKQLFTHQPKRVTLPEVIQVACGSSHSIALTENGRVHTWGLNGNGQLGTGLRPQSSERSVDAPTSVDSLIGVPITQVAAGGRHSVVLSASGAVFSWGENLYGQLGCGDNSDRHHPGHVKSLRSMKVVHVTCGDGHTAALTKEGRVFTFGADTYGQLGHGSRSHSSVPKPVLELMGSTVTRVACGRCHTVVIVNQRMYSFGLGTDGQLGLGSPRNAATPRPIPDTADVFAVFAGGDRTFFLQASGVINETPGPNYSLRLPKSLSLQRVHSLLSARDETLLIEELEAVLSSSCCVNGSFLKCDDTRFNASKSNHGVDLDEAMEAFNFLASSAYAEQHSEVMQKAIEISLLLELTASPPDVEAMRVYIILPWCHSFSSPAENYKVLHVPFANAILGLTTIPAKILEHWWTSFAPRHFNRVVRVFKSVLEYILSLPDVLQLHSNAPAEQKARDAAVLASIKVLAKLNAINMAHQKIPIETFYLDELADKRDIVHDFVYWSLQNDADKFYWSDYPFVFNAAAKTTLLQTDAKVQMQLSVNEANRQNIAALFVPFASQVNPFLVLQVDRQRIVFDTLSQLLNTRPDSLRKPLKIVFAGEEADDAGGVKKEFFMLLFQELLDPNYGMFVEDSESHEIWFSGSPFEQAGNFQLIGILCGLAIYNGVLVDFHFPLALYKKLLGQRVTLDDLKQLNPTEGRSLEHLLDYEGDDFEEVFGLTFTVSVTVFDQTRTIELRPNGAQIPVIQENKQEYVDLYVAFRFDKGPDNFVKQQFDAFADGFYRVMTSRILKLFQPKELMEMVIGNENYDWEEFRKNAEYRGSYWVGHESVKLFWEIFFELTLEERKKFLLFLTGSNRIPLHGMKAVKIVIQPAPAESMPVAHTCFNLLDLPQITDDKELMRRKLLTVIEYTQGFSIV